MGRKRKFEEEKVMIILVEHFWMYGYNATKVDDLAELTGLTKSSLYNAFGNKEVIFKKVIDFYIDTSLNNAPPIDINVSLSENLNNLFVAEFSGENDPQSNYGCLLTNSIAELSFCAPELHKYISAKLEEVRLYFRALFLPFITAGKVKLINADELTDLFMTLRMGLKVQCRKESSSQAVMNSIAQFIGLLQVFENYGDR